MKETSLRFITVLTFILGVLNYSFAQISQLKSDIGLELYTTKVNVNTWNPGAESDYIKPLPAFSGAFYYRSYIKLNPKNYLRVGVGVGLERYAFEVSNILEDGINEQYNQFYTLIPVDYVRLWEFPSIGGINILTGVGFEAAFYDHTQATGKADNQEGSVYEIATVDSKDYGNIVPTVSLGVRKSLINKNYLSLSLNKKFGMYPVFEGRYIYEYFGDIVEVGTVNSKREQFTLKVTYAFTTKAN